MSGFHASQVGDFFRAAARFYRARPWRTVDEGEAIEVRCEGVGMVPGSQ